MDYEYVFFKYDFFSQCSVRVVFLQLLVVDWLMCRTASLCEPSECFNYVIEGGILILKDFKGGHYAYQAIRGIYFK